MKARLQTRDILPTTEDPRWQAVVGRDRAFDGQFFYSVRTTGVYCRPSCAARLANPENVRFHRTQADARRAGFRACKRCKPDQTIAVVRAPTCVRFSTAKCSLGVVLVAQSKKGICAILFGDSDQEVESDFRKRFPGDIVRDDAALADSLAQVVTFTDSPRGSLDRPLDMQGTPFQRRVWKALVKIGAGRTASYTQIAQRIGAPTSVRAVAQACAANPIALAIPCHRVVRSDGGLSGYRWGAQRKRALLAREAEAV